MTAKKQYVYEGSTRTDRGTVLVLRNDDGERVKLTSRKRFNQLCDERRVHFPAEHRNPES